MQYIGERAVAGSTPDWIWKDHVERYRFGARLASGKRTLDIACGTGYGSRKLLDRGAKTVVGVDASFGALQHAKRQYRTDGIDLLQGDIRSLPFCENAFDLITCFETIEHVADQMAVLSELKRVLSADGVVVFSTPNRRFSSPRKSLLDTPNNIHHRVEYNTEEFFFVLSLFFDVTGLYGQRTIPRIWAIPGFYFGHWLLKRMFPTLFPKEHGRAVVQSRSRREQCLYNIVVCRKKS